MPPPPGNGSDPITIDGGSPATSQVIFHSEAAGGTQRRGVKEFSIYNGDDTEWLLARCDLFQDDDEWVGIPPGKSFTFVCSHNSALEIDKVYVKSRSGADVEDVTWGVSGVGHGSPGSF